MKDKDNKPTQARSQRIDDAAARAKSDWDVLNSQMTIEDSPAQKALKAFLEKLIKP